MDPSHFLGAIIASKKMNETQKDNIESENEFYDCYGQSMWIFKIYKKSVTIKKFLTRHICKNITGN